MRSREGRLKAELSISSKTEATSSSYLPPETLDYIVDLLHDESSALNECCLVSKSWIPRTRRHLFAHIQFYSADDLKSWKKTFPDPAKSPAYRTHTLFIGCVQFIEEGDAEEDGWIQAFSRVEQLVVNCPGRTSTPWRFLWSLSINSPRLSSPSA